MDGAQFLREIEGDGAVRAAEIREENYSFYYYTYLKSDRVLVHARKGVEMTSDEMKSILLMLGMGDTFIRLFP